MDGYQVEYYRYIASRNWQIKRQERLAIAQGRCDDCGASNVVLEVHHIDYAHLGDEPMEDLSVLCIPCHDKETDRIRRKRYKNKPVMPNPTVVDFIPKLTIQDSSLDITRLLSLRKLQPIVPRMF